MNKAILLISVVSLLGSMACKQRRGGTSLAKADTSAQDQEVCGVDMQDVNSQAQITATYARMIRDENSGAGVGQKSNRGIALVNPGDDELKNRVDDHDAAIDTLISQVDALKGSIDKVIKKAEVATAGSPNPVLDELKLKQKRLTSGQSRVREATSRSEANGENIQELLTAVTDLQKFLKENCGNKMLTGAPLLSGPLRLIMEALDWDDVTYVVEVGGAPHLSIYNREYTISMSEEGVLSLSFQDKQNGSQSIRFICTVGEKSSSPTCMSKKWSVDGSTREAAVRLQYFKRETPLNIPTFTLAAVAIEGAYVSQKPGELKFVRKRK